ncbi:MAG TPA: putative metallopeptidase [Gammaproteobacteria bacterium]|nr:putative metallopeptidase [Gammaproteobacteria bacterium]
MADAQAPFIIPAKDGDLSPYVIYDRLVQLPEFAHLAEGEAVVDFLIAAAPVMQAKKQVLGACHLPVVQGKLRGVFVWMLERTLERMPDFLVTLDMEFWTECSDRQREILVYHEMKHMIHDMDREGELRFDEEGRPVWALIGHDIEEFTDTVSRYGAYSDELQAFVAAVRTED